MRNVGLGALLLIVVAALHAGDLTASLSADAGWIGRYEPLVVQLSRPIGPHEHFALVIGAVDVTGVCSLRGDSLVYTPTLLPYPSGPLSISLYVIAADSVWDMAGSWSVHVLTAAGLERHAVSVSLAVGSKGELAADQAPDAGPHPGGRIQELNGQLTVKLEGERAGMGAGLTFNLIGVSFRQEALRFQEKKENAAKIDLSSYLLTMHMGRTVVSVGHLDHGRERHLLNGFASRGIAVTTGLGGALDLSAAAVNGTSVVGWDNVIGLEDARHRLYSGTVGLEVFPGDPGTARIEGSYVHGSQLPLPAFDRAVINDAEQSDGGSLRLVLADPGRSIHVDAGVSRARFVNPTDPLLDQGASVVPVEPTVRSARYVDVSWDVLSNAPLFGSLQGRLNLAFRHERVDPLYRVVGAAVRPDNLQNAYELHGGVGPGQVDLNVLRSEDNLADVASILKSRTHQTMVTVGFLPPTVPGLLPAWFPAVTYGLFRTHQFGEGVPSNSQFTPERVPDQVTTTHSATCEWQWESLRFTLRGTVTRQDNQQPGRENADAVNRTNGIALALTPLEQISMTIDGGMESKATTETGSITRTVHCGLSVTAALATSINGSMNVSLSQTRPDDGSARQRQVACGIEGSYAFDLTGIFAVAWRGQAFMRYGWNEFVTRDQVFNINSGTRSWSVNAGVACTLF